MTEDNKKDVKVEYNPSDLEDLPNKSEEKIMWSLPFEFKLKERALLKAKPLKRIVNPELTINIPEFNDITAGTVRNFSQESGELTITSLILPIPSSVQLYNGNKIHLLKLLDPDITEDNMIWLMTKCYCVREIQIIQKENTEASLKSILNFLASKAMKILNMSSRTLRILKITGQDGFVQFSHLFEKSAIDFAILKDCTSLQSLLILKMPLLTMKNIPDIPLSLGHLAFEVSSGGFRSKKELINLGFIDFSNPVAIETFQYILRLPRLKKIMSVPLNGQMLMETCQSLNIFNAFWCSETNRYKLKVDLKPTNTFSQSFESEETHINEK